MDKSDKFCVEDPSGIDTRKVIQSFERRFEVYILLSIIYGLVFINYIDVITAGALYEGYHLWLIFMYFLPFLTITIFERNNWKLTLGLGLLASLMNDLFYGAIRNLMGSPIDLGWYYSHWLVPGNTVLFNLNLGFTTIQVTSWIMALSIYARIPIILLLLRSWRAQAKIRCLNNAKTKTKKQSRLPEPINKALKKLGLTT